MTAAQQLELPLRNARRVNVDGLVDAHGIRYIGEAVENIHGKFTCLADIGGLLCRVEVTIASRVERVV